ncbi:hypothetical protein QYF36_000722 [Acer negundo]|nr:hypothetical protein QYF36_000722 [Acer negundo]
MGHIMACNLGLGSIGHIMTYNLGLGSLGHIIDCIMSTSGEIRAEYWMLHGNGGFKPWKSQRPLLGKNHSWKIMENWENHGLSKMLRFGRETVMVTENGEWNNDISAEGRQKREMCDVGRIWKKRMN